MVVFRTCLRSRALIFFSKAEIFRTSRAVRLTMLAVVGLVMEDSGGSCEGSEAKPAAFMPADLRIV